MVTVFTSGTVSI